MPRATSRSKSKPSGTALLIVDMLSDYRFPDANRVLNSASRVAKNIARLKARAHHARVPVIYVNDTAGKWESDQTAFVQRCLQPSARGHRVVELIEPAPADYFMFKPRHSAFYETPLLTLLQRLHVGELILTGLTSHQCVLFTAVDAHVRGYELIIPPDCIAAPSAVDTRHALYVFSHALQARVTISTRIRF